MAPSKLSAHALLSPMRGSDTSNNNKPFQSFGKLPHLSFPLLSQEETAIVQPLSPLSVGSDLDPLELTPHLQQPAVYPN